jgi:hypothetical protein
MRRREFIGRVGVAAVMWPITVRAQQSAMPVVGFLSSFSSNERNTAAFIQGLKELGFVDGQNVLIDYRSLRPVARTCGGAGSSSRGRNLRDRRQRASVGGQGRDDHNSNRL